MNIKLAFGKGEVGVDIPDENIQSVLVPNPSVRPEDPDRVVADAIASPIGSPRLSEIVGPGEKIVIVTSDITRPMPSHVVLPHVLRELSLAGVRDDDVEVVLALGIHRSHTEEEKRMLVGDAVFGRVRVVDSDPERCVRIGATATNRTPVDVFKDVVDADRRICLGNIEFHYFAGYSGGGKALMPGVCSHDSIQANHSQMVRAEAAAGRLVGNPVRHDIDDAAAMIGVNFIVNVVLDEKKRIVHAVAGDFMDAHREGARLLDTMYKTAIDKPADIVLVSPGGFPKDINLYQAQKALDNAKHAVRDGGIIILVASCKEGLGEDVFEHWMLGAETSGQMIADIQRNFELGGHKAAAIAMILERARIFLVSDLRSDFAKSIFFEPFPDVSAALSAAFAALGGDGKVIIMPYGGATLPCLE